MARSGTACSRGKRATSARHFAPQLATTTWPSNGGWRSPRSCQATGSTILASSSRPGRCQQSAADLTSTGRHLAALVLAGGRARRLGGVDKPAIEVGGRTLLGAVTTAAAGAGACHLVLVGPAGPELATALPGDPHVEFTTERPPGAGPVPALRAGLALITAPWLLLLAADLPFLRDSHLRELVAAAEQSHAGALLVDDAGRPQWLLSCWRTDCLRTALTGYEGSSLGGLLGPLRASEVAVPAGNAPPWLDCDTPEDVAAAGAVTRGSGAGHGGGWGLGRR